MRNENAMKLIQGMVSRYWLCGTADLNTGVTFGGQLLSSAPRELLCSYPTGPRVLIPHGSPSAWHFVWTRGGQRDVVPCRAPHRAAGEHQGHEAPWSGVGHLTGLQGASRAVQPLLCCSTAPPALGVCPRPCLVPGAVPSTA